MPGRRRRAGSGQSGRSAGRCRRVQGGVQALGPGKGGDEADSCLCPACGAKTDHQRGIPCLQVTCAQCGKSLVRRKELTYLGDYRRRQRQGGHRQDPHRRYPGNQEREL
jgi:hypothetical protein